MSEDIVLFILMSLSTGLDSTEEEVDHITKVKVMDYWEIDEFEVHEEIDVF